LCYFGLGVEVQASSSSRFFFCFRLAKIENTG
jgi:hypothetical protein